MKKLVALLVIVAFSASIYAQAQPQKSREKYKKKNFQFLMIGLQF